MDLPMTVESSMENVEPAHQTISENAPAVIVPQMNAVSTFDDVGVPALAANGSGKS